MRLFEFTLMALLFAYGAPSHARVIGPESPVKPASVETSVTVDLSGSGNFTSVQAAINWVPSNNAKWVRIHVKPGIYKEKVNIPKDKQFIYLEGEDEGTTSIQWDEWGNADENSTFAMRADNFVASHITFKNTHDIGPPGPHKFYPASAIVVWGDKAAFYNCRFISLQDTLSDWAGRHLFESCYIEGAMDFIWGSGQSQYKDCKLNSTASSMGPGRIIGFVTAQGRTLENDTNAFVFLKGSVEGSGLTYLGRAYRPYSTVIFSETNFGDTIHPEGWTSWNSTGHEDQLTFVESGCTGRGSDKSGRVKWMKTLSPAELNNYLDTNKFINKEGWIEAQPAHN